MTPRPGSARTTIAIALLCVAIYAPAAALTPFFTKGEPREGVVVRQMLEAGDWLLPRRLSPEGASIASKPPLFHWLAAGASAAIGRTSEWSVRLPSLVLATVAAVLVWRIGGTVLAPTAGLAGAVVLATTFEWVRAASTARVDATLTAFMTAGLLLLYRGFVRDGLTRGETLAAAACFVCATLAKGPVGFALPALVLAVALIAHGRIRSLPRFHPLLGVAVVLALVGAWYLTASLLGGDAFVRRQILKENVFRFLGASRLKSGHVHPFYYYVPALAAGFLPWTPFLVGAVVAALRNASARRDPRVAFLLAWVGVVFVFYSVASAKRSVYLLALYPGAALLTGWWWAELTRGALAPRWLRGGAARAVAAVACVAAAAPVLLALAEGFGLAPLDRIAPLLHHRDRANLPLVRAAIDAYLPLALAGATVLLGTLIASFRALRREDWARLLGAQACFAAVLWILVFGVFQPVLAGKRSLEPFMQLATREAGGQPLFFYPSTFDYGAAFYAPAGITNWRPGESSAAAPRYVLIWDTVLARLPESERAALEVLATSDGTDPNGRMHMVLARRR